MANGVGNRRRVRRVVHDAEYVNTINVGDRVAIDFVWFPGAPIEAQSHINPVVPNHPTTGQAREITYTWKREGQSPLTRTMEKGRITISLPQGSKGTLEVFGTTWEITRYPAGTSMNPVTDIRGVQHRLNRLGYHLRRPGYKHSGIDGSEGRITEHAVLQFQNDYVPPPFATLDAANMLHVRGEWKRNDSAQYISNLHTYHCNTCDNPNPSDADGKAFQAAIKVMIGS